MDAATKTSNCHGKERFHDTEEITDKQVGPKAQKENCKSHCVERRIVRCGDVDHDSKTSENVRRV